MYIISPTFDTPHNRHRAIEQRTISLEEYRAKGGQTNNLVVKPHPPTYQRRDRVMPGAVFLVDGKRKVMTASRGLHNSIKNDAMIRRKKKMICENCKNGIKSENLESIERTEACQTCNNQIIPKTEIENVLCPACSYIYHRCEKCGKDLG